MSKVNLYFFRHGQTEWNRVKKFQGSNDIPLNDTGREQAKQLGVKLNNLPIEAVISSDLSRAKETAQIAIGEKSLPTFYYSTLQEANLGVAEGLLKKDFLAKHGQELWDQWISPDPGLLDFKFPGGETKRETRQRAINCIERFVAENTFQHIAVSTHGGVISRVVHFCEGAPVEGVAIPNGCLYHVAWEGGKWTYVDALFE